MIRQPVVVKVDAIVFWVCVLLATFFLGYEYGMLSVTEVQVIKIPVKPDQPCIRPGALRKLVYQYSKENRNGR